MKVRNIGLSAILLALALTAVYSGAKQPPTSTGTEAIATFAGGCFWCVESDFDHVKGVLRTTSGYAGGHTKNPTYKDVSEGGTGHIEVVQIAYDPNQVSYEQLLDVFWRSVDPTDDGGQFCDRGHSYRTAIFPNDAEQKRLALASKESLSASQVLKAPIVTQIAEQSVFYPAEDYHQDYYLKNPVRYHFYRGSCGRDKVVKKVWGEQAHRGIEK